MAKYNNDNDLYPHLNGYAESFMRKRFKVSNPLNLVKGQSTRAMIKYTLHMEENGWITFDQALEWINRDLDRMESLNSY